MRHVVIRMNLEKLVPIPKCFCLDYLFDLMKHEQFNIIELLKWTPVSIKKEHQLESLLIYSHYMSLINVFTYQNHSEIYYYIGSKLGLGPCQPACSRSSSCWNCPGSDFSFVDCSGTQSSTLSSNVTEISLSWITLAETTKVNRFPARVRQWEGENTLHSFHL
jgi:hypothetical protein